MISWSSLSNEEQTLLNPAFCAFLIWIAAKSRLDNDCKKMSIWEVFILLALILPGNTRGVLPRSTATSLPVWLKKHPVEHKKLPQRVRALMPYAQLAVYFGASQNMFQFEDFSIVCDTSWEKEILKIVKNSSDEVKSCTTKARLVGRWLAASGNPTTILSIIGVKL